MTESRLRIGVDVGGTNTDAVLIDVSANQILSSHKAPTTADVVSGLIAAIREVLGTTKPATIESVSIGTTAFLNAIVERSSKLSKVAVIRLCGPATHSLPPMTDFPEDLARVVRGQIFLVSGGFQVDGRTIGEVDPDEIAQIAKELPSNSSVAVSGVFSTLRSDQEKQVKTLLLSSRPDLKITLSSEIAPRIGLLERENATILNAALVDLARKTVLAITSAMASLGLGGHGLFLTTNDGTVVGANEAMEKPINCIRSGPTNSMRGAAFLAGLSTDLDSEYVVLDIGGTTTDVGILEKNGFVRPAASTVSFGGVRTNFACADVGSCALGGGTIVRPEQIGPDSVGFELTKKAMVFGGDVLTLSDIAVASGLADLGDAGRIKSIPKETVEVAQNYIKRTLEKQIDLLKTTPTDVPCLLVGGGSILVPAGTLAGTSKVILPPHSGFANAVGAAIARVSGSVDMIFDITKTTEADALAKGEEEARRLCLEAGGEGEAEVVMRESVPLSYAPGVTRIVVKVVAERGKKAGVVFELATTDEGAVPTIEAAVVASVAETSQSAEQTATSPATTSTTTPADTPASEYRPHVTNGIWYLSATDINYLETGCGILGCGGGGSPYKTALRARALLAAGKSIRVVTPESVGEEEKVLNVGFIGSPVAAAEKLSSGREVDTVLRAVAGAGTENNDKKIIAIEIGGSNGIVPMLSAAESGGFVVDADGMGRAFPRLDHFSPFVYGVSCTPTAICDESGNVVTMSTVKSFADLERIMRCLSVEFGSTAALSVTPLSGADMRRTCILNSVSLAWRIGRAVELAKTSKTDPIAGILSVCPGKLLFSGKIVEVKRTTTAGFARGEVHIAGIEGDSGFGPKDTMVIIFQNENITAALNGQIVCTTPDLITLIDADNSSSLATEEVRYGVRVKVIAMLCSPIWQTERALAVVGPEAFGYPDVTYRPIAEGKYVCKSVIEEYGV